MRREKWTGIDRNINGTFYALTNSIYNYQFTNAGACNIVIEAEK